MKLAFTYNLAGLLIINLHRLLVDNCMSTARLMGAVFATLLSRMFRMTVWLYVVPADLPTNLLFYLLLNKLLSFPRERCKSYGIQQLQQFW